MEREQLQRCIEEVIAEEVIKRVQDKLIALQKKALVVCTGATISKTAWLVSLQQLKEAGFTFDLFLTKSAVDLFDPWVLESTLTPGRIIKGTSEETPEVLSRKYHTIIVPAMTIYTAAKVASCMGDTPASKIIFDGLMRGKNVVIAVDGCCPDNPTRAALGYCPPEPLKQALRDNMEKMRSYGATLTTAERLAKKTLSLIQGSGFAPAEPVVKQQHTPAQTRNRNFLDVRVLGNSDILTCPSGSVLVVPSGCLVTQMALDTARGRGVVIEKQTKPNGR